MNKSDFKGPLFVSGMPRSGTKLLRDLLNNHSRVAIPENESLFIPRAIRIYGKQIDFSDPDTQNKFWNYFVSTKFYGNQVDRGLNLHKKEFFEAVSPSNWTEMVSGLFTRCSTKVGEKDLVWGDKTPGYVLHMDLLKEVFPEARFVHIVRDPRDYVCSVRNAWGRSVFRAADRWRITMDSVRKSKIAFSDDYLEVHYESLIQDPETVLKQICEFASVDYEVGMHSLKRETENLGDAKGQTKIVSTNFGKFLEKLTTKELQRVEEIVFDFLESFGYEIASKAIGYKPLSSIKKKQLRVHDIIRSAQFHMGQRGVIDGLKYYYKLYRDHSWRNTAAD